MHANRSKGYSGDGGPATAAQLANPTALRFDHACSLFIGDGGSVRMISPEGIITTIARNGTVGFTDDGGAAASAETSVSGLAFDNAGRLYIADPWNSAIQVVK